MSKYGVLNEQQEVVEIFPSLLEADERAAEIGGRVDELVENLWWIKSDWTEGGTNYITVDRNAQEFAAAIDRSGIKQTKLAELCGKKTQTFCLYTTGRRNIPRLVIEKVQELEKLINKK